MEKNNYQQAFGLWIGEGTYFQFLKSLHRSSLGKCFTSNHLCLNQHQQNIKVPISQQKNYV